MQTNEQIKSQILEEILKEQNGKYYPLNRFVKNTEMVLLPKDFMEALKMAIDLAFQKKDEEFAKILEKEMK